MHNRGIISRDISVWKIKVPLKVRIFIWLMLDRKILTQRVMLYRGCDIPTGCHLCQNNLVETRDHIMGKCVYAVRFWWRLMVQYDINHQGGTNIQRLWKITGRVMSTEQRARWNAIWAAGAWALWRERNRRLFFNKWKTAVRLIRDTILEIENWKNNL